MKLHFFGQSAFLLETGEYNLLFDPFLTGNPLCTQKPENLPKIDFILLTHGHRDHVGDAIAIAKKHHSTIIASPELCGILKTQKHDKFHPVAISGFQTMPFGKLKVTDALHSSSITIKKFFIDILLYAGLATGLMVEINGKRIFHAGDTALTLNMQLLEKDHIDVAILPVGGNYTMNPEDANAAIEMIKPKTVIPCHYNTFPAIKQDISGLKNAYGNVMVMQPNSTISL